jgi:hypothetical protein
MSDRPTAGDDELYGARRQGEALRLGSCAWWGRRDRPFAATMAMMIRRQSRVDMRRFSGRLAHPELVEQ